MNAEQFKTKSIFYSGNINRALKKIHALREELHVLRSEVKYWRAKQNELNLSELCKIK